MDNDQIPTNQVLINQQSQQKSTDGPLMTLVKGYLVYKGCSFILAIIIILLAIVVIYKVERNALNHNTVNNSTVWE